jgi:hypothetical protein
MPPKKVQARTRRSTGVSHDETLVDRKFSSNRGFFDMWCMLSRRLSRYENSFRETDTPENGGVAFHKLEVPTLLKNKIDFS